MHHLLSKAFNTGTWFSAIMFFVNDYINADAVFKSIMAMLSLTLLVLQIGNQWQIRRERLSKLKQ